MSESGVQFELERAITGNELALHYQPRVLLSDLRLRGVEALVRWRHPVRGIVPPSEFIDLAAAERGGSMRDLQAWVIRESLLQAGVWRRDGLRVGMSVNITLPLLHDEPFLKLFERTLTIHGDPETFIFEVAAAALGGAERPVAGLARLRERGVRLALDDVTDRAGLDAARLEPLGLCEARPPARQRGRARPRGGGAAARAGRALHGAWRPRAGGGRRR